MKASDVQTAARLVNLGRDLAATERKERFMELLKDARGAVTDGNRVLALRKLDNLLVMMGQPRP